MKHLFLCCTIMLGPILLPAQQDTNIYKIVYDYTINIPPAFVTGQRNIVLHSAKRAVSWLDQSDIPNTEYYSARIARQKESKELFVYKNFEDNNLIFEMKANFLPKDMYVYTDSLYPMKWVIGGQESMIDSIKCLNATCIFRGRNYEAWFAPGIPINEGPWKLGGLPGLIISVQDIEGKYIWKLNSISVAKEPIPAAPASKSDINFYKTAFTNGLKKVQESMAASSSKVDPNCINCSEATVKIEVLERF